MNKTDLIEAVAKSADISKAKAGLAVDSTIEAITKAVASGEGMQITGFCSIKVSQRAARTGRNPKTGETMKVPAKNVVKFTAGSTLKQAAEKAKIKK